MKQRGISLVELMISLFLACLLVDILILYYLSSKRHYLIAQEKLTVHSELQLAANLIRDSVRNAGFTPCLGLNHLNIKDRRSHSTPTFKAVELNTSAENSLIIRRMSDQFSLVEQQLDATHLLVKDKHFLAKDMVLIADCFQGEIQQIKSVHTHVSGLLITLDKPLFFNYLSPMYLGVLLEEQFFTKVSNQGINNLFYKVKYAQQLTTVIDFFTVKLKQTKKFSVVEVCLGSKETKLEVHARVRIP